MDRKILFVDDDTIILKYYTVLVKRIGENWTGVYEHDTDMALLRLKEHNFDIVVSDFSMPKMNGAELLEFVCKNYPQCIRIMISSGVDEEMMLRRISTTVHQFLPKTCGPEYFKKTIDRIFFLRKMLDNENIIKSLDKMESVPTIPTVYHNIEKSLKDKDSSIKDIGNIISKDPAIMSKILQLVNSAYFGLNRHISDPIKAVSFLGIENIKILVLSIGLFSQIDKDQIKIFTLENLWEHSLQVGILSKRIAEYENENDIIVYDSFCSGLLHDLGKILLIVNFPDKYKQAIDLANKENIELYKAERKIFSFSHEVIGAYLLGIWGIPYKIIEAIIFHHGIEIDIFNNKYENNDQKTILFTYIANILISEKNNPDTSKENKKFEIIINKLNLYNKIEKWKNLI